MAETLFLATERRSNVSDSSTFLRHKPQIVNHHQRSYFRHVLKIHNTVTLIKHMFGIEIKSFQSFDVKHEFLSWSITYFASLGINPTLIFECR